MRVSASREMRKVDIYMNSQLSLISKFILWLYPRRLRLLWVMAQSLARKVGGGEMYSATLREIFRRYHGVTVGLYTHGDCFTPYAFDRHTIVGRYCSIAEGVRTMNRGHPQERRSTHGFFFNPSFGVVSEDTVEYTPLEIGSDVWIGYNAVILPAVRRIGHGAVIGAGAVVNKDVPDYGVVVGNPARVVRYRFSPETIQMLLDSRWWEKPIEELRRDLGSMTGHLEPNKELNGRY